MSCGNDITKSHFNPHPHTEGDSKLFALYKQMKNFNPHPHTEGDMAPPHIRSSPFLISIHTLTRRVTIEQPSMEINLSISIHTLTRRVTDGHGRNRRQDHNFNPHPHTEGDFG